MASHEITYTLRDRLGSVVTLTNHNNLILEHRSFDPFGKPRYGTMQASSSATLWNIAGGTPFTMRGFTDHEHIDEAQLIHMNGRVYDYNLGRFLSVDPFIQEPGNSQSLNPYSYIMNNPLAGTDPSGYVSVGNLGLAEGGAFCGFICAVNRTILAGFTSAGDNGIGAMSKRAFGQQIAELGGQKDFAGYTWLQGYKRNISKPVSGGTDTVFGDVKSGPDDPNYFLESDREGLDETLQRVNELREGLDPFKTESEAAAWLNENAGDLQDRFGAEVGAIIAKVYGDQTGFKIGMIVTSYHSNYVDLRTSKISREKMDYVDTSIKNRATWHTHSSGSPYASWGVYRDSHKSYYRAYVSSVGRDGKPSLSLYDAPAARAAAWPVTREAFDKANTCLIGECR